MARKTAGMFTYKIKMPMNGSRAHFLRDFKSKNGEPTMKEHWCFFFLLFFVLFFVCFSFLFCFYTKFHVQALKSTLIGTYEIYSLSYRTF